MRKIVTLKTGNTSWWKNIKYRREAATDLKKYRKLGLKILKIKTYRLQGPIVLSIPITSYLNWKIKKTLNCIN